MIPPAWANYVGALAILGAIALYVHTVIGEEPKEGSRALLFHIIAFISTFIALNMDKYQPLKWTYSIVLAMMIIRYIFGWYYLISYHRKRPGPDYF